MSRKITKTSNAVIGLNDPITECSKSLDGNPTLCSPIIVEKIAKSLDIPNIKSFEDMDATEVIKRAGSDEVLNPIVQKIIEKSDNEEVKQCDSEKCVVEKLANTVIKDPIEVNKALKNNYKLKGPAKTEEWLSNFNIDDFFNQLVENAKSYKIPTIFNHIGFQMRDFAKHGSDLASFNVLKMAEDAKKARMEGKPDKYYMGVAMNTDYSSGSGIHWYALAIDFNKDPIEVIYFNSSGDSPLPESQLWIEKTTKKLNDSGYPAKQVYINKSLQKDNFSCGVYTIYFVLYLVMGRTIDEILSGMNDKNMKKFRRHLFHQ
jgi:hypothetical protein